MPAWKNDKTKKPDKWCCSFYYTDWTGARKHKTKRGFSRKKDAEEWEREFLNKFAKSPSISFAALCENYFEHMAQDKLKITTLRNKRSRIEKNILPYFAKKTISEIEPLDIINWQNYIQESGRQRNHGKGFSSTYLNTLHTDLSSILNYAVRFYHLPSNPCTAAGSMGKPQAGEMKIWTLDEFEQCIAYEDKPGAHLIFNILFWGGLREGEALALCPGDFLSDRRINVSKTFVSMDGEEYFLPPKTPKSKRQVAIPEFVYQEAMSYINSLYEISPDERIFYFTRSFLYKEIRRISHAAGVDCIRVHDLRHPYVKHTTKKYNSEKQKTQTTNLSADSLGFLFLLFILRLCP
jgi:integrase